MFRQLIVEYDHRVIIHEDLEDSNLVDSASSHTLVSKIKPCMSKYKYFTLKLRMAHYISYSLFDNSLTTRITVVILELIRAYIPDLLEG